MAAEGSIVDLVQGLSAWRLEATIFFIALPLVTLVGGHLLVRTSGRKPASYFLALAVYLAVLPGIPMTILVAFLLFFARSNLFAEYDAVLFFGPVVSMVSTLLAASRVLPMDEIPGFGRLRGLMMTAGLAFTLAYLFYRLGIHLVFFGSLTSLVLLFLVLFIGLKISFARFSGPGS